MITQKNTEFNGHSCIQLSNGSLTLWATTLVGPRILGLSINDGANLFAIQPAGATLTCPGTGELKVLGGHRLWHAPEDARRTYLPDEEPLNIQRTDDGIILQQPVEAKTGIQKSIQITMNKSENRITLNHTLSNLGLWPIELAPWAITQMRVGGTAILPFTSGPADPYGLLPNRPLILWPYTDLSAPYVNIGRRSIRIQAKVTEGAFKIGFANRSGWLAYLLDSTLFVKRAAYEADMTYYDMGSSSECYCNSRSLELETLGPRRLLTPGQSIVHKEDWTILNNIRLSTEEGEMLNTLQEYGLDLVS